jgi:HEAT repeat protein
MRRIVAAVALGCALGVVFRAEATTKTIGNEPTPIEILIRKIYREPPGDARDADVQALAVLAKREAPNGVGRKVVDDIAGFLLDSDDVVRYWAAAALGFLGAQAESAIPALERALREREGKKGSKSSASAIRLALERIRSPSNQPHDSRDGSAN